MMRAFITLFLLAIFIFFLSCGKPSVSEKVYVIDTTAGDSGNVIKVTNLHNKGKGSLRWALAQKGPRKIVFEVGGVIDLNKKSIKIREPFVTVLGESAPMPGITLIRGGLRIEASNVKISHLMIRPGDAGQEKKSGWKPDGITVYGGKARNIIIDHCSITWAVDENVAISGPSDRGSDYTSGNVIIKNSIIAEALSNSSHPEGPHSKGLLVHNGVQHVSIIYNLFAHNTRRNPYFKSNTSGIIKNNIIYNPGQRAIHLSSKRFNFRHSYPELSIVGNMLVYGINTRNNLDLISKYGYFYINNNVLLGGEGKEWDGKGTVLEKPMVVHKGVDLSDSNIENKFCKLLSKAGARPWEPNNIDLRIKNEVLNREGQIIDSQEDVGGYPNYEASFKLYDGKETKDYIIPDVCSRSSQI